MLSIRGLSAIEQEHFVLFGISSHEMWVLIRGALGTLNESFVI